MKRTTIRFVSSLTILLTLAAGLAGRAQAGPLNPLDFTSLGAFPTASGTYTFDTNGPAPTLTGPDGTTLAGVVFNGIAVFDFDSINVAGGGDQYVTAAGSLPLALLSRTDATIAGTIDGSGQAPPNYVPGSGSPGGPGGGYGGQVPFPSSGYGPGFGGGSGVLGPGAGGGGFGGPGGEGAASSSGRSGGAGGGAYANLAQQLQGGSGGGASNNGGGGGGGGIEIGAVRSLVISGSISVNGGTPFSSDGTGYGAGGGSGGGVFLHADSVLLTGILSAAGGDGGSGGAFPGPGNLPTSAGGGGGGGAVTILGAFSEGGGATIDVRGGAAGGPGSAAGGAGVITVNGTIVPEPASLVLMGTGMLALLGICRRHRRIAA